MKRIAYWLPTLTLVATLCLACNPYPSAAGTATAAETGTAVPDTEKTELILWHYHEGFISRLMAEYCETYSAENSRLRVLAIQLPFGDFKKQLSVGTAAGNLPDMVMVDNCDCVAYASMGIFRDITDTMRDNEDLKDYYQQIMDTCYWQGRMYAVPANSNNLQIYYNKNLFQAAGIEEIPGSWEDLRRAAMLLTTETAYGFGMCATANEEGTFQYLPFQYTAGGNNYDLDSAAGLRAVTFLTDLVNDGSMPKDVLIWSQTDVTSQFIDEKLAMMMMGCWFINATDDGEPPGFEWDNFPVPKDVTYGSVYGGENLAIIDGPNGGESLDFLEWFIQYDRNKRWNIDIGHFNPRHQILGDPDYTNRPHWKVPIGLIPHTVARPADPDWPQVSQGYQLALQEALSLQSTPEEAIRKGQAVIDSVKQQ